MKAKPRIFAAATLAALTILLPASPAHAHVTPQPSRVTATPWPSALSTATGMAAKVCGAASKWTQIRDANGLRAPYWLMAGRTYVVPCATGGNAAPAPAPSAGSSAAWVAPLAGTLTCVSGFGVPRPGHTHKGIDLPRPSGSPIRAAHAGTVTLVRYQATGAGWYVMLANGGGVYTVYMHMVRRSFLSVGQKVKAGQTIGYVGSTGHSSGPHLHFETHVGGAWHQVNPATFLRARGIAVRGC